MGQQITDAGVWLPLLDNEILYLVEVFVCVATTILCCVFIGKIEMRERDVPKQLFDPDEHGGPGSTSYSYGSSTHIAQSSPTREGKTQESTAVASMAQSSPSQGYVSHTENENVPLFQNEERSPTPKAVRRPRLGTDSLDTLFGATEEQQRLNSQDSGIILLVYKPILVVTLCAFLIRLATLLLAGTFPQPPTWFADARTEASITFNTATSFEEKTDHSTMPETPFINVVAYTAFWLSFEFISQWVLVLFFFKVPSRSSFSKAAMIALFMSAAYVSLTFASYLARSLRLSHSQRRALDILFLGLPSILPFCMLMTIITKKILAAFKRKEDQNKRLRDSCVPYICYQLVWRPLAAFALYDGIYESLIGISFKLWGVLGLPVIVFITLAIETRYWNRVVNARIEQPCEGAGQPCASNIADDKPCHRLLKQIHPKQLRVHLDQIIGDQASGISSIYRGHYYPNFDDSKIIPVAIKRKQFTQHLYSHEPLTVIQFTHENVIKCYGWCKHAFPHLDFVYELGEKGSLSHFLRGDGAHLKLSAKLRLALEAAEAMRHVHSKGYIHRDLKAENYVVTTEEKVKLIDFDHAFKGSFSKPNYPKYGTKRWLAPEVFQEGTYSQKSDVFSYGIVLWEIFANETAPYSNLEVPEDEIEKRIVEGARPHIPEGMPRQVTKLMEWCWNSSPASRPTAEEVVDRLSGMTVSKNGKIISRSRSSSKERGKSNWGHVRPRRL